MVILGTTVILAFTSLAFLEAALPHETTLLQYGALGAMCVFLMALVTWLLKKGAEIIGELRAVLERNSAALEHNSHIIEHCIANQDAAQPRRQRHGD